MSLEPMRGAFTELESTARREGKWTALHSAAGAEKGEIVINITANSVSSSILPMFDRHAEELIGSGYVATETAPTDRIDSIITDLTAARPFLKFDTQGFERAVLDGARRTLSRLVGVEIELTFAPICRGQTLWREDIAYLETAGFRLVSLTPGFWDPRIRRDAAS